MSKSKNETAPSTMSTESIEFLEDVKKGKPRKFAMICKGVNIVSLVVYKKGSIENRKKEAKESGKGQFYFGTVDGQGMDIRFVLARADGFEAEPVKRTVLKTFLDEQGLKSKPYFEIVDIAPLVLDEDDPIVARFLNLRATAKIFCENNPDRSAEIKALVQQIGSHLDQDQPNEATAKLDQLEKLLGESGNKPSGPTDPPSVDNDALKRKLQEALGKLVPQLKQAVADFPDRKMELLSPVNQIKQQLESGELQNAKQGILNVGQILKTLISQKGASAGGRTDINPDRNLFLQHRWQQAVRAAHAEIQKIIKPIQSQVPQEDPQALVVAITQYLDAFVEEFNQAILATWSATPTDAKPIQEALKSLRSYRTRIAADPVLKHLNTAQSELGIDVTVVAVLMKALDDLEPHLAS